jgi:hypothetical protein
MKHKSKQPGKIASNDNFSGPSVVLVAGAGSQLNRLITAKGINPSEIQSVKAKGRRHG